MIEAKPISFDYFVLALSWSPTYCASNANRGSSPQCQNENNRGFVVHGLWPQANDGARLRCDGTTSSFSKSLYERAVEIFPDIKLAQSQWQRHGQCFGFPADAYLEQTALAKSKLTIPSTFHAVREKTSFVPDAIRSEFMTANPGLQKDAISVSCRKSALVEVLVCLKSDLSGFASCPQLAKRTCRASTIEVPAFQSR